MIKKLFSQRKPERKTDVKQLANYRELIRREAELGGSLFGELPEGGSREFFCLDKNTWIWHEEWTDTAGQRRSRTTRYDIRPDIILKAQDGAAYQAVSDSEARNFIAAAKAYQAAVSQRLYGRTI